MLLIPRNSRARRGHNLNINQKLASFSSRLPAYRWSARRIDSESSVVKAQSYDLNQYQMHEDSFAMIIVSPTDPSFNHEQTQANKSWNSRVGENEISISKTLMGSRKVSSRQHCYCFEIWIVCFLNSRLELIWVFPFCFINLWIYKLMCHEYTVRRIDGEMRHTRSREVITRSWYVTSSRWKHSTMMNSQQFQ